MRYKSCVFIEKGLQFNQKSVSLCYQRSCSGGGYGSIPLIDNYKGEPLNLEFINKAKTQIIESNKKGEFSPVCNGCIELKYEDWPEFSGKIGVFNLDYWTYCNSNCIYCYTYNQKGFYNTQYTYGFLSVLEDLKSRNMLQENGFVNFGGGEVALLDEFTDIIKIFEEYNYDIMVHTGAIDYIPILESGLKKGKVKMVISIDAGSEEMHAKVKQVRTFKKVWNNLVKYAEFQKNPDQIKIKYIVIPDVNDDKNEILLWLDRVKDTNIKSVCLEIESSYLEQNRGNIPDRIYELFLFAKEQSEKRNLRFTLYDRASHMMTEHQKYKECFSNILNV